MFGTIRLFHERGFGFIRLAPPNEDLVFHLSEFDGDESQLVKGTPVEFEIGSHKGKRVARNIRILQAQPETTASTNDTTGAA